MDKLRLITFITLFTLGLWLVGGEVGSPSVEAQALSDIVRLKNGGLVRGTIVESVPNDHVLIKTVDGRLLRYQMSQVQYAGPDSQAASPGQATTTSTTPSFRQRANYVPVRFVAPNSDAPLTLHAQEGSAELTYGSYSTGYRAKQYRKICTAPCKFDYLSGSHQFALSRGDGGAIETEEPIILKGSSTLAGEYDSSKGTRTAGWIVMISSIVVGTALAVLSFFVGEENCSQAFASPVCSRDVHVPLLISGLAIPVVGSLISLPLILDNDEAKITMSPGPRRSP